MPYDAKFEKYVESLPSAFSAVSSNGRRNSILLGSDALGNDVYFPRSGLSSYVVFSERREDTDNFFSKIIAHAAGGRRFIVYLGEERSQSDIERIRLSVIREDYTFERVVVSEGDPYDIVSPKLSISAEDIDLGGRFLYVDLRGRRAQSSSQDFLMN